MEVEGNMPNDSDESTATDYVAEVDLPSQELYVGRFDDEPEPAEAANVLADFLRSDADGVATQANFEFTAVERDPMERENPQQMAQRVKNKLSGAEGLDGNLVSSIVQDAHPNEIGSANMGEMLSAAFELMSADYDVADMEGRENAVQRHIAPVISFAYLIRNHEDMNPKDIEAIASDGNIAPEMWASWVPDDYDPEFEWEGGVWSDGETDEEETSAEDSDEEDAEADSSGSESEDSNDEDTASEYEDSYDEMKKDELQDLAEKADLKKSGSKEEIKERLREADEEAEIEADD